MCVLIALACGLGLASPGLGGEVGKIIKIEPEQKNLSMEQKAAVQLAQKFVADKNTGWGLADKLVLLGPQTETSVGKGAQIYTVYFPTPQKEAQLLGTRGVDVNVATKQVKFLPRD
jgi:hypothetical protein